MLFSSMTFVFLFFPIVGIIGAASTFRQMLDAHEHSHVHIASVNACSPIFFALSTSFKEAASYNPFIYFRF